MFNENNISKQYPYYYDEHNLKNGKSYLINSDNTQNTKEYEQDISTKYLNDENLKLNEKEFNGFKDTTDIPCSIKEQSDKEDKGSFMIPDDKNLSPNMKKRGRQKKNICSQKEEKKSKEENNKINQITKNNQKPNIINRKSFTENVWVHMSCALWIPEVHIEDFEKKENIKCKN